MTIIVVAECNSASVQPIREFKRQLQRANIGGDRDSPLQVIQRVIYRINLQIQLEPIEFNVFRMFQLDYQFLTAVILYFI